MGRDTALPRLLLGAILSCVLVQCSAQYFGKEIGSLSELHHGVSGRVYAIDSRTIFIKDFTYDGEGPTAYFYVGASKAVNVAGAWRLRDERGGAGPLRRYRGEGVTLSLPEHKTFRDIRWFAVWCDEFAVNFGDVSIPSGLEYPRPVKVGALRGVHGVSSDAIVVVDAQTLLVPNFSYDGEAPDAKFWVGRGDKPSPQGVRIPDENGKEAPLRRYDRKTIVLTLPGELTIFDIGHFGVWCEAFTVNFGHVTLPRAQLRNVPPSLKMLGVSPQSRNEGLAAAAPGAGARRPAPARGPAPAARLDATTYRPHLAPGAIPLAAFLNDPAPLSLVYRRAETTTTPAPNTPRPPPPADHEYFIHDDDYHNQKDNYQMHRDDYQNEKDDYRTQITDYINQKNDYEIQKYLVDYPNQKDVYKTQENNNGNQKNEYQTQKNYYRMQKNYYQMQKYNDPNQGNDQQTPKDIPAVRFTYQTPTYDNQNQTEDYQSPADDYHNLKDDFQMQKDDYNEEQQEDDRIVSHQSQTNQYQPQPKQTTVIDDYKVQQDDYPQLKGVHAYKATNQSRDSGGLFPKTTLISGPQTEKSPQPSLDYRTPSAFRVGPEPHPNEYFEQQRSHEIFQTVVQEPLVYRPATPPAPAGFYEVASPFHDSQTYYNPQMHFHYRLGPMQYQLVPYHNEQHSRGF